MESVISPVVDNIISRLCDSVATRTRYLRNFEKNLNTLHTEMEELKRLRNDVKENVNTAEDRGMTRTEQVDGWLQNVEAMEGEVDEILQKGIQQIERRCLGGCCPKNCCSSYKLGKKVAEKLTNVEKLKSKGVFNDVVKRGIASSGQEQPSRPTVGMNVMFDKVWRLLGEERVGTMGLYGMGGVGKTTLLKRINNEFLKGNRDHDQVLIWVVVSKDSNVGRVQKDIGEKLGLSWHENTSQDTRAADIFKVLSRKKFVILLDDIWESVDLETVGIPLPGIQNKSKVIFTTRSEDVCGQMEARIKFRVECLKWEEAWDLFQDKVGEEALSSHPDIPELATTVAKECGGLPLALITIGRAMASKKTPQVWREAIRILKKSASEFTGMGDKVFPLLKYSYDNLRDDTMRSCFLYCSLFPEDDFIYKKDLIEYWIGEGFIDGFDDMNEARDRGHDIIENLMVACLLESVDVDEYVRMHDVIRDLAIWIASQKGMFLVQARLGLSEAPEANKWEEATRISLMHNQIKELLETPRCPNLLTLILLDNPLNRVIDGFFQFMPVLRVLDLRSTKIELLPMEITELVELQYLNLSFSKIKALPKEFGNLVKLNYLELRYINTLVRIPREALLGLSRLQVLNMHGSRSWDWEVVEGSGGDGSEGQASLGDLEGLKSLNTLGITITTTLSVQKFFHSHKLRKCTRYLSIVQCQGLTSLPLREGENLSPSSSLEVVDLIDLHNLNIRQQKEGLLLQLYFKNLRRIKITRCHTLKDLTWLLYASSLQYLHVSKCEGIEEVICGGVATMEEEMRIFSKLESISIWDLPELKSICERALPFPSLRTIWVIKCPKLRKLPLDSNSANNTLKEIRGPQEWWDGLEWEEDETIKSTFIPYFR